MDGRFCFTVTHVLCTEISYLLLMKRTSGLHRAIADSNLLPRSPWVSAEVVTWWLRNLYDVNICGSVAGTKRPEYVRIPDVVGCSFNVHKYSHYVFVGSFVNNFVEANDGVNSGSPPSAEELKLLKCWCLRNSELEAALSRCPVSFCRMIVSSILVGSGRRQMER